LYSTLPSSTSCPKEISPSKTNKIRECQSFYCQN
jgi:hypothetical protein